MIKYMYKTLLWPNLFCPFLFRTTGQTLHIWGWKIHNFYKYAIQIFEKWKIWFFWSQTVIDWSYYSSTFIKGVNTAIKKAVKAHQTLFLLPSTFPGTQLLVGGALQGPRNSWVDGARVLKDTHWPTGTFSAFKPVCCCKRVYFISTTYTFKDEAKDREANGPMMSSRLYSREGGGADDRTHPVSPSLQADIYSTWGTCAT